MNRIRTALFALMVGTSLAIAGIAHAQTVELQSRQSKFSYAIGVQIGTQIAEQFRSGNLTLDFEAAAAAISDVLLGNELQMTAGEMAIVVEEVTAGVQEERNKMVMAMQQAGDEYRTEYAKGENVQSTASGLLYKVISQGDGTTPGPDNTVTVHYRGTLIDGSEFDSSYSRNEPTSFPLNGIIPGWKEVLQLMPVGSKWEVVIPPELAYGERGAPPTIPPLSTLIFEIELLSFE